MMENQKNLMKTLKLIQIKVLTIKLKQQMKVKKELSNYLIGVILMINCQEMNHNLIFLYKINYYKSLIQFPRLKVSWKMKKNIGRIEFYVRA